MMDARQHLEDLAPEVKGMLQQRLCDMLAVSAAYRTANGSAALPLLGDAERKNGEFFGALDMAHAMGYRVAFSETQETIERVWVG